MSSNFKETVFLPSTSFPMKAGLAQKEIEILNFWKEISLYDRLRAASKGKEKFILHYGPPYANGHIHIGHALSEILKDIVNKTKQMQGYDAPMIPGWDCHGLPIEWKIEEQYRKKGQDKDQVPLGEFRQQCRDFAMTWIDVQREEFKRLGIIADWENPYITMDKNTEADIVEQLGHFLMNESLYRGHKPVMWSVVEKTALADTEVEYHDHTSDSIYVSFPVIESTIKELNDTKAVIWTTTPWTLPGNRAIAYGEDLVYVVCKDSKTDQKYLVAQDLLEAFTKAVGMESFEVTFTTQGAKLYGSKCAHPLREKGYTFDVPFLPGEHVTTESGTGLVHTAPGHGLEDFEVGKRYGLEIPETVQGDGKFYDHVPLFASEHVYKVNPKVIEALKEADALLFHGKITHSYPHSWRSKAPLIYRTTSQWFISMEKNDLREKALNAIEDVQWFPAQGKNRIRAMVENRPDWCVSRQRAWGTPITVFIQKATGEVLRDAKVHARIVDVIREEGIEGWFSSPSERFLASDYPSEFYEKGTDIIDVWFDSGCSHHFTLNKRDNLKWPADLYLEGSDQHRGWFQTSLLESCGTVGKSPYKQVLTHGFVLDEKGYKMSKSQGNVVAPEQVIKTLGADMLRLWVAFSDYSQDLRIGPEILKYQEDVYRRLRNTLRYLLGALHGFKEEEKIPYDQMPDLEKWVLGRLFQLHTAHEEAVRSYDLMSFYTSLHTFCSTDLSAFYFDIRKDTLYCDKTSNSKRRSTRTVMDITFNMLCRWLAPVLSFTSEEAYRSRYGETSSSIHEELFMTPDSVWNNEPLDEKWKKLRDLRRVMTGALEIARANKVMGSSLQAHLDIYGNPESLELLKDSNIEELAIVSSFKCHHASAPQDAFSIEDVKDIQVVVSLAKGAKCQRCWKVLEEVTLNEHTLCKRCDEVVKVD